jgi:acetate kinase
VSARVLALNTGSSSVKLALFDDGTEVARQKFELPLADAVQALRDFAQTPPTSVVHRVVHGGTRSAPALIDDALVVELERLSPLSPNHNPVALSFIASARTAWPGVPQVAVFDTSFFADLPTSSSTYALPSSLRERYGLRRYGFHGLAHESMWRAYRALGRPEASRIVTFQLGSGCSAAAIQSGKPLDTSMGFTPLEGLVMRTRAGDLDPGLVLFLVRKLGLEAVEQLLAKDAGLRGLSGMSGDTRELLEAESAGGAEALHVFVHRARKYLGAYLAVLQGADAVVFGGGIAEHSAEIRARIVHGFEWCGLLPDAHQNASPNGDMASFHRADSKVELWVARVDEERLMLEQGAQAAHVPCTV